MNAEHNENVNRGNLSMMQVVEVQANEEMGTSVDFEDYTHKILDHQEQVFVELDLPTSSNHQEDKPAQIQSQSQSGVSSEELCNYTLKLMEQHENVQTLDLTSSSSENEEFGDENEQAVYETVTGLVDRVVLKIDAEKEQLAKKPAHNDRKRKIVSHAAVDYRRYVCYWCDRRYDMLSSLKAHVPSHLEQARPQCNICHKTYYSKSSLRDHMRIHTGERPYACNQCDKRFITSGKLGKHMRWHNKDFRHACNLCGKVFLEAYTLRIHMRVHEKEPKAPKLPKPPKMWNCKKCDAGFTRRNDLRIHNKDIHKIQRTTTPKSSATTKSSTTPAKKRRKITPSSTSQAIASNISPTSDGLYECQQCVRKFFSLDSLLVHVRKHERNNAVGENNDGATGGDIVNTGAHDHGCKVCGEQFDCKADLQHHMTEVHSDAVKHKCPICQQIFSNSSTLKKHVLMHSSARPFNCDQCAGTYKTKDDLKRHKRTHMVDRPFKCPQCGHGFVDNTGLIRHVRTHTGERPFICPDCMKAFSQSSSLKSHRAKKHPDSTIKLTNLRGGMKAAAAANKNSAVSSKMVTEDSTNASDAAEAAESNVVNNDSNVNLEDDDNNADLQDDNDSGGGNGEVADNNFTSVLLNWLHHQQNISIHSVEDGAADGAS